MEIFISKVEKFCKETTIIFIDVNQEKLVRDIASLSDNQLNILEQFVNTINEHKKRAGKSLLQSVHDIFKKP